MGPTYVSLVTGQCGSGTVAGRTLWRRALPSSSVTQAADQDSPAVLAVRRAAAAMRPEIEAVATGIGEAVRVPRVEERAGVESTHRTFIAILASFLDWVEGGREPDLNPDALALARETARAGAGLRVITRGLRVGHRNFLELWDRQLARRTSPPTCSPRRSHARAT